MSEKTGGERMLVGITYDLRLDYLAEGYGEEETAEFDKPDTIDAIESALRRLGYDTDRIGHARRLTERLAAGHRWDIVFNIAEGMKGFGREAEVPAILEAYGIPTVFSDALVLSLTLHKAMTKRVVRDLGIPTPDFCVVESEKDIASVRLPYPLFAKPVAEGTGKGVNAESKIKSAQELKTVCRKLLAAYDQPVLVEAFLPGREFTVGIIGTGDEARSAGVIEVELKPEAEKEVYSYVNKERCEELVVYKLAKGPLASEAEDVSLRAWKGLGCRDAGRVDVREGADGRIQFMEVNPLAGLHPVHSDLPILWTLGGGEYLELMRQIMESAVKRVKTGRPAKPAAKPGRGKAEAKARVRRRRSGRVAVMHGEVAEDAPEDEKDVLIEAEAVSDSLSKLGFEPARVIFSLDLNGVRSQLEKIAPEFVFNLVESVEGKGSLIHLAPALLDYMGLRYTGCPTDALYTTSNKLVAKMVLMGGGIQTPHWVNPDGTGPGASRAKGMFVIKSKWEHASIGLDDSAFVTVRDYAGLMAEMEKHAKERGTVYAEAFVEGREFNIASISENGIPRVLPHAEIQFVDYPPEKLKVVDYNAKWTQDSFEYNHTPRTFKFGPEDGPLLDRLTRTVEACWKIFDLDGYARVDFRVDAGGIPWVLEVNSNPCISPEAGFAVAAELGGLGYTGLIERIVDAALSRKTALSGPAKVALK